MKRAAAWISVFLILVVAAIMGLDRPLASWVHASLHGMVVFTWLSGIAEPVAPLSLLGLAGMGLAAVGGWRPGGKARVFLACCLAAAIAFAAKEQLKFAFGRTWPETWTNTNPSWIADGIFGFVPFHGGRGWAAFPSGHTTLIAAPMAVLWLEVIRWRWLWAGLVILVGIGLIGANFHWLSDVIAGAGLGIAAGFGAVKVVRLGDNT